MNEDCAPAITQNLLSKGKNTLGHETNLARSPIWHARQPLVRADSIVTPTLFGHPFRKVQGDTLTTVDQRLFAYVTTDYVRRGCPQGRDVPFSLGTAAQTLGYDRSGGRQRALIRASLARLRAATFESALRHPDGHESVLGWGLIESYLITTRGGGKGWVRLSETVASLLREGSVTFLHAPTWDMICSDDEVAGRLWCYLESEHIGRSWRYSLFASDAASGAPTPSMPSIAQVLQLSWSSRKRRVVQRVRDACAVIERHDRRYRLVVTSGRQPESWVLTCSRTQGSHERVAPGVPDSVIRAWRRCHRSRVPSRKQRDVLCELLSRRSPEWIVHELESAADTADPFGAVMQADRTLSARDLAAAKVAEECWEQEKRRESIEGEQSLVELIGMVRKSLGEAQASTH